MEIDNKMIQTCPHNVLSYSEKKNKVKTLKNIKKNHLSINNSKKITKNKLKDNEGQEIIRLQHGTIIGKLYKKTNETEWAAQNKAIKEKPTSDFEIKQILRRYKFNKEKLSIGFTNEYLNLLSELLYSKINGYSKERLKLSNYRKFLSKNYNKNNKKYFDDFNGQLNKTYNNFRKHNFKYQMAHSPINTLNKNTFKRNEINENFHLKTLNNNSKKNKYKLNSNLETISPNFFINNSNNKTLTLFNKNINGNLRKINYKMNNIGVLNYSNKKNNNTNSINTSYKKDDDFNLYKSRPNTIYDKINNNYLNLFNNNNISKNVNINLSDINENKNINKAKIPQNNSINKNKGPNTSIKPLCKSNSFNNSKDLKNKNKNNKNKLFDNNYKNEDDIYFEKEKEENIFLIEGKRDKYEDYLKNKFNFFDDMENKQTQYINEIKKRSYKIFDNKNIEIKNNHKYILQYIQKVIRGKNGKTESNKKNKFYDFYQKKNNIESLNKLRLKPNTKNILKNLKKVIK